MSDKPKHRRILKRVAIAFAAVLVFLSLFAAGAYAFAQSFDGRIAPNVTIGPLEVGGLDPEVARQKLHDRVDEFLLAGVPVRLNGEEATIGLISVGTSDQDASANFAVVVVDEAIDQAMEKHREGPAWLEPFTLLLAYAKPERLGLSGFVDEERLKDELARAFPDASRPVVDAGFAFAKSTDSWEASITPSSAGQEFFLQQFLIDLENRLSDLSDEPITLAMTTVKAAILEDDVQPLRGQAEHWLARAPFVLAYDPDRFTHREWNVSAEDLAGAMVVRSTDDAAELAVNPELLAGVLDLISQDTERSASDARFTIENGRVVEFSASATGIVLDRQATAEALRTMLAANEENQPVPIFVQIIEPAVDTKDVNDLGIKEILGVGTSSYKGSPANRIKNIRNGVRLLNGILIKPGEEFSLLTALKPFDTDNGYLPELVIKGDRIEPELGGGLCQIGTTTFRAAMNAGLPIVERQNHSLVVRYYNDPSNGNPGTDATIYDPSPDFKFLNDTGNTILFQAEMDEENAELRFTFWGTSDGRQGSYTPPELIRWIGVGETVTIETEDLAPGEKKCQSAHVGADAQFTYTIVRPDGSMQEQVFESHYRPLPEICLVGKEPDAEEETEPENSKETEGEISSEETDEALSTSEPLSGNADAILSD